MRPVLSSWLQLATRTSGTHGGEEEKLQLHPRDAKTSEVANSANATQPMAKPSTSPRRPPLLVLKAWPNPSARLGKPSAREEISAATTGPREFPPQMNKDSKKRKAKHLSCVPQLRGQQRHSNTLKGGFGFEPTATTHVFPRPSIRFPALTLQSIQRRIKPEPVTQTQSFLPLLQGNHLGKERDKAMLNVKVHFAKYFQILKPGIISNRHANLKFRICGKRGGGGRGAAREMWNGFWSLLFCAMYM